MIKILFECETITPMFMYGADGLTPELRPASIKGVMRFWWRAINGNNNIEQLRDAESEIFGSTDKKSKVIVRVRYKSKKENIVKIKEIKKMPYLFYPFYLDEAETKKSCFINLKFEVILSSRDEKALKEASYAFILLSLFGGLGSRSRRGGGSFRIVKTNDSEYNKLLLKNSDRKQLSNSLYQIYGVIKKYFQEEYRKEKFTNEYSNLSNLDFALSYTSFDNWESALQNIEKKYKNFRADGEGDGLILDNTSFGLPILEPKEVFIKPEIDRRASPMIIKILQVQNKYYWFVLKLNGEFLPSGTKIGLDKENINEEISESIIDDFLGTLP